MANWIPFHEELRRGKYRGLRRGVRFVLLELSIEAKPKRGIVELPLGMSDLDGICDILGGDRREVAEALRVFCAGDDPALVLEGPDGARRLRIPGWERRAGFNASREPMGASTKRSQAHRERKRNDGGTDAKDDSDVERNGDATVMQRPLHDVAATDGNGSATAIQDRTGQDRPPSGGHAQARAGEPPPAEKLILNLPDEPGADAVLQALRASEHLRELATAKMARELAKHSNAHGNTGRLGLDDVLHAVRRTDQLERERLATPGEMVELAVHTSKRLFAVLRITRRGEAREPERAGRATGGGPPRMSTAQPGGAALLAGMRPANARGGE